MCIIIKAQAKAPSQVTTEHSEAVRIEESLKMHIVEWLLADLAFRGIDPNDHAAVAAALKITVPQWRAIANGSTNLCCRRLSHLLHALDASAADIIKHYE